MKSHSLMMLLFGSAAGIAAPAAEIPPTGADTPIEIVVSSPRGHAGGAIEPLVEVSEAELGSYGVDTLSDLVDALRPLTRSTRSDQMAVVLINGHLAGQTEFDNLPREAIERVEVLPESVALQYGFSENQRVLNFILREHYRSAPVRLSDSGATEGGAGARSADASLVRLEDEARVTLLGSYKDNAWLRESDRGIGLAESPYRTLQPDKSDAKIAGTVSRSILGVSASAEASFDVALSRSLQGLAGSSNRALEQSNPERTARVATQLTGQLRSFVWGVTANYLHVGSRTSSETDIDAAGNAVINRSSAAFNAGNLQLSVSGPAASLPAGPLIANLRLGFQYQGFATSSSLPGVPVTGSNLVRTVRSGNVNASIPLASRDHDVLPGLGELSATLNASLDEFSDFGTLVSTSYGFDWKPFEKVHVNGIYTDHRTAPTAQQLRSPPILTPNVELFDFVAGQTAYVTEVTGGNTSLAATNDRLMSFGLSLGPFVGKTVFSAHYERSSIRDAIGYLPPTTADVESAFPERFRRDSNGVLRLVDNRWANFEHETTDDLKWGFSAWMPLGEAAPRVMPNRIEISLFDTWYLHDATLIRSGIPQLDLLDGAPSDVTGGQPHHKVEFRTLIYRNGVGAALNAAWRSPTKVDSGDPEAPNPVFFSSLATADLRVFAEPERMAATKSRAWAKGARISVIVTNLFDSRQAVRDATGITPIAFKPGYLDPPGRVLSITVRKVF